MSMKIGMQFSLAMLLALSGAPAFAADATAVNSAVPEQTNALGRCFVNKTTGEDRIAVARWMLGAMASAPKMADLSKVDAALKVTLDKGMAGIFTRLITVDCVSEARPLLQAKNNAAFETAGEALGEIAIQELLADPRAMEGLSSYVKYLDQNAFAKVYNQP